MKTKKTKTQRRNERKRTKRRHERKAAENLKSNVGGRAKHKAKPKVWRNHYGTPPRMTSSDPDEQEKIDRCNLLCDLKGWSAQWLFDLPEDQFIRICQKHL